MPLSKISKMIVKWFCISALFAFGSAANASESIPVNGRLQYRNGNEAKRYDTVVFFPRLHGQLKRQHGEPYLVFSGLGCRECDINRSIYIHSPSDAPIENGERTARYPYPGHYFDIDTNAMYERVRMFFGRCLPRAEQGILWQLRTKQESGTWITSYFVARVDGDRLIADYINKESVSMQVLRKSITQGICKELPGRDFYNEP